MSLMGGRLRAMDGWRYWLLDGSARAMMVVAAAMAWGTEDGKQVSVLTQRLAVLTSLTVVSLAVLAALVLVWGIAAALTAAVLLTVGLLLASQREMRILVRDRSKLQRENERLQADLCDGAGALEAARADIERERHRSEALLQDTSHRIGSSLATISSLLTLQFLRSGSDDVRQALEAARSRVHVIASAHRRLRLGDGLETTSAEQFLDAVLQDLAGSVANARAVKLIGDIEPIEIKAGDATTVGLLVGELVTNALNHAFPDGRTGCISVSLKKDTSGVPTLSVSDDGVGIDSARQTDEAGLGSVIIKQLARQFGSVPFYQPRAEGGLRVLVPLPGLTHGLAEN